MVPPILNFRLYPCQKVYTLDKIPNSALTYSLIPINQLTEIEKIVFYPNFLSKKFRFTLH
jgi:hypothetical protein